MGYSPWRRKESNTTERLHFHFDLAIKEQAQRSGLTCLGSCSQEISELRLSAPSLLSPKATHSWPLRTNSRQTDVVYPPCTVVGAERVGS